MEENVTGNMTRADGVKKITLESLLQSIDSTKFDTVSNEFTGIKKWDVRVQLERLHIIAETCPDLDSLWLRDVNPKVDFEEVKNMFHKFTFFKKIGRKTVNVSLNIKIEFYTRVIFIVSKSNEPKNAGLSTTPGHFEFHARFNNGFRTAKIVAFFLHFVLSLKTKRVRLTYAIEERHPLFIHSSFVSEIVDFLNTQRPVKHMKSLHVSFEDEDDRILSLFLSKVLNVHELKLDITEVHNITSSFVEAFDTLKIDIFIFNECGLWFERFEMNRLKLLLHIINRLESTRVFQLTILFDSCVEKTFYKLKDAFAEIFDTLAQIAASRPLSSFHLKVISDSVYDKSFPLNLEISRCHHFEVAAWNETDETRDTLLYLPRKFRLNNTNSTTTIN